MTQYTEQEQKEHRAELVAALRSGEYQQITGRLTDETGYCCLGVACEISGLGEWSTDILDKPESLASDAIMYVVSNGLGEYNSHVLPRSVREYYGFAEANPDFRHLQTCLLYTSPSPRDRTRSRMPSSA